MERTNCFSLYDAADRENLERIAGEYRKFMSEHKTERECVSFVEEEAVKRGFVDLNDRIKDASPLKPGDKIFMNFRGKNAFLIIIGKNPLSEGMNYIGAHVDSPRLDLKQDPLFEDQGLAYLDTHYYGGIKKYQWLTIPLALHGVVAKKDGTTVKIAIGENPEDPVFCISDLLPHLAQEQVVKPAASFIDAEKLDVLICGEPLQDEEGSDKGTVREPVKAMVLSILKDHYNIEETDFISAELEIVPAGPLRDLGLDRSMLFGYGQDDRSCAYSQFRALMDIAESGDVPDRTIMAHFVDKEEVGSIGATGAHSRVLENLVGELMLLENTGIPAEIGLRRCLQNTCVLSADVSSAFDPVYASAFAQNNAAKLGCGITFLKYTGARGKSNANDASAEYLADIRRIMDEDNVHYQTAEIGRVDLGGGGTIAYIIAVYGGYVIDCGIPVMSMHSPGEVISKADLYEAVKCYRTFYLKMSR